MRSIKHNFAKRERERGGEREIEREIERETHWDVSLLSFYQ